MPRLPIRPRARKPSLRIGDILAWADEYHAAHGRWPSRHDGLIDGTADQTWAAVDQALTVGGRGLPGGTTLAKLLLRCRSRPHYHLPPDLTLPQILRWADAHHRRTGEWPGPHDTDPIPKAPAGLTWAAVETALVRGTRGLPGGCSLAALLERHRGVRNRLGRPDLTAAAILGWADAAHRQTGRWPKYNDGDIAGTAETWAAVNSALVKGGRGLPGGDTLARFLARHRGVRNKSALPRLTFEKVKKWAVAHRKRTGRWPSGKSGPVVDAPGETWSAVDTALLTGLRGFPNGDSLARFLVRECGKRDLTAIPPLSLDRIRDWVVRHHASSGKWPHALSGPISGVPGETWGAVANALLTGRRGLPRGTTLGQVVQECRKKGASELPPAAD